MTAMRRRPLSVAAITLALALIAAACGGDDGDNDDAGGANSTQTADKDAELTFALSWGANSFDPHRSRNAQADAVLQRPVYDSLLTLVDGSEGVELAPQLATAYEVAADGLSIEFTLRRDVTFQDGAKFDATAVKANLERALDAESTIKSTIGSIQSVEVVDSTTVVLHLSQPDPSVPWTLGTTSAGMMVSPTALANPDLATKPVGSGPWRLVSFEKDASAVYERFDDHWNNDAALVRKLTILTVTDGNVRYNGIRTGEYDAAYIVTPQDAESKGLTSEGFHWVSALSPNSFGVLLNLTKPPFTDVRVRRAVNMAINRVDISKQLLRDIQPPTYQAFNKGYLGFDPELDEDPYDPSEARALIRDAGAEGATITMPFINIEPPNSLAAVVQQALTDIGLKVNSIPVGPSEGIPRWRQGNDHAYIGVIIGYAEPSQTLGLTYFGPDNFAKPPPAELVDMANKAAAMAVGSAERERAYQQIGKYLQDNPIHIPIAQFSTVIVCQSNVVGCDNTLQQDIGKLDFRSVGVAP